MNKNIFIFKNIAKVTTALVAAALVSCGGGTCAPNGNGNGGGNNSGTPTFTLTAPNQFPAGQAITAYLTMTNTSTTNATNLYYSVPEATNYTGATITVANDASQPCKNIAAGASCTFPVNISANSHSGSFTVTATPNGGSSSVMSSIKSAVGLKDGTISVKANIGVIDLPPNSQANANGITFLYSHNVAANSDGSTLVSVVAVVNSAQAFTAGAFNTINLTDANGNLLNFRTLSANSGVGATNLSIGSVVSFLLTIPANTINYQFYAQTKRDNQLIAQGTNRNQIGLASQNQGVLSVQPSIFNLSSNYSTQIVTYTNTGNGVINNLNISNPAVPLSISDNNCQGSLAAGQSCTYRAKFDTASTVAGSGFINASYNDGSSNQQISTQINYKGANATAGLVITSNLTGFSFNANTVNTSQTAQLTITNTGATSVSNIVLNAISPFTISSDTGSTACSLSGSTVSSLAVGTGCTVLLTYTGPAVSSGNSTLSYTYTANSQTISGPIPLSYQTVPATVNLSIRGVSNPFNYGSILNDGIESIINTFTVINNGPEAASGLNIGSITGDTSYFNYLSNGSTCGGTLNAGESCTIAVRFGPSTTANSSINANLPINFTSASYGQGVFNFGLTGIVRTPQMANIIVESMIFSDLSGGDGLDSTTPFLLGVGSNPTTITLIYTNDSPSAASNISVSNYYMSMYWNYNLVTDGCSGQTLLPNKGNSCTVVIATSNTGANDLPLDNSAFLGFAWDDEMGSQSNMTALWQTGPTTQQGTVYVTTYALPTITLSPSPISIPAGESADVTVTLNNGINVPDQTVSIAPGGGISVTSSPSPCVLNSNNPTCTFTLTQPGSAVTNSVTSLVVDHTGTVPVQPNLVVKVAYTIAPLGNLTTPASYQSVAVYNNTPYVAFQDNTGNINKATVFKYNGSEWESVGPADFSAADAGGEVLKISPSGVPYILFYTGSGSGALHVMKFNGTSWEDVGATPISASSGNGFIDMALDTNGNPYVSFDNGSDSNKPYVMAYNGTSWSVVGNGPAANATFAFYISLALDSSNRPYLIYKDNGGAGDTSHVVSYSSGSWGSVGTDPVNGQGGAYQRIVISSNNVPYVSQIDVGPSGPQSISVFKLNDNNWDIISGGPFAQGTIALGQLYINLALDNNNVPYVVFQNSNNGSVISLMRYDGLSWDYVGGQDFSSGPGAFPSITFDSNNNIFVAYQNSLSFTEVKKAK